MVLICLAWLSIGVGMLVGSCFWFTGECCVWVLICDVGLIFDVMLF